MIAVTGATGNLGGSIIRYLLEKIEANEIVALARTPSKASSLKEQGITVRQGDYDDRASLVKAFSGIDTVLFVSGMAIGRRIEQHKNVVDAAVEAGIRRIVYTSIASEGDSLIAREHLATEEMIRNSGLEFTILRNNFYVEKYVVEIEIAIKTGAYRSTTGEAGVAFISRQDLARAAAAVLTSQKHAGKTYSLTGPDKITAADFARVASEISGKEVIFQPITMKELVQDYLDRGMSSEDAELAAELEIILASDTLGTVSDDYETLMGKPATSFDVYMKNALA